MWPARPNRALRDTSLADRSPLRPFVDAHTPLLITPGGHVTPGRFTLSKEIFDEKKSRTVEHTIDGAYADLGGYVAYREEGLCARGAEHPWAAISAARVQQTNGETELTPGPWTPPRYTRLTKSLACDDELPQRPLGRPGVALGAEYRRFECLDRLSRHCPYQAEAVTWRFPIPIVRSDKLDARFWEAIVQGVIRKDHLEKALRELASESQSEPDRAADILRLEAELKRLVRAEEILLERFRRGVVTEAALDRELLVLAKERASVTEAIASAHEGMRTKADLGRELVSLREAAAGLRERLRIATPQDRRDRPSDREQRRKWRNSRSRPRRSSGLARATRRRCLCSGVQSWLSFVTVRLSFSGLQERTFRDLPGPKLVRRSDRLFAVHADVIFGPRDVDPWSALKNRTLSVVHRRTCKGPLGSVTPARTNLRVGERYPDED